MRRLLIFLLFPICAAAQSFDHFGGLMSASCGAHPQAMTITAASQSGTTQTVTVSAITSAGVSITGDESFYITGSGSAMDFVFTNTKLAGASILTNRVGTTLTLTSPVSQTVSGVTIGTIYPAKAWHQALTVGGRNRQVICTPEGHWLFLESVASWMDFNTTGIAAAVATKYGSNLATMATALKGEFAAQNFNGIGELGATSVQEFTGNIFWPEIDTFNLTVYSGVNLQSYASGPVKDLGYPMNSASNTCWFHGSFGDFFGPQFGQWMAGFMGPTPGSFSNGTWASLAQSPWSHGMMIDDTDWFWGMGAGPDFRTVPVGHNACDPAYNILTGAPVVTADNDPNLYGGGANTPQIYSDSKNYSKTAMASPPTNCNITTPCSLRDFLAKKYGTIGSLNTAWGSSYTTFDSTGTVVSGESIGTGNGVTLSFAHTMAHTSVEHYSIQVLAAGVDNGGDCPQLTQKNGCSSTVGQGTIVGPNMSGGSCVYSTGVCTFVWTGGHAPSGALTANYVFGGWPKSINGGTGLMDEDGSSAWLSTGGAGEVIADPPAWQAAHAYTTNDEIKDGNENIQIATNTATSCGTVPTFSVTEGNNTADNNGCANGLVWLCLGTPAWRDQTATAPNGSSVVQADLHAWLSQYGAQYSSTVRSKMKADNPAWMYFGADTVGAWCVPVSRYMLQGLVPYVDNLFTQICGNQPTANEAVASQSYLTQSFTGPLMEFSTLCANLDSAMGSAGAGTGCQTTQPNRAAVWNQIITNELTSPSFSGDYPWTGAAWWGSHDYNGLNGEFTNWGLKTFTDNRYDGVCPASGVVPNCPTGFNGGSEPVPGGGASRPFGNLFGGTTGVTATNALWFSSAPPPTPGCVIGGGSFVGSGSIICDTLTVNYSSPTNPLTFTFQTPNILNLSVAASTPNQTPPPPVNVFPLTDTFTFKTQKSPKNKIWNCTCTAIFTSSTTDSNSCTCQ